jgi:hypothetical protein
MPAQQQSRLQQMPVSQQSRLQQMPVSQQSHLQKMPVLQNLSQEPKKVSFSDQKEEAIQKLLGGSADEECHTACSISKIFQQ